jgi:hypothetical protein
MDDISGWNRKIVFQGGAEPQQVKGGWAYSRRGSFIKKSLRRYGPGQWAEYWAAEARVAGRDPTNDPVNPGVLCQSQWLLVAWCKQPTRLMTIGRAWLDIYTVYPALAEALEPFASALFDGHWLAEGGV